MIKKTFILGLLGFSSVFNNTSFAQKKSICDALNAVTNSISQNFDDIKGSVKSDNFFGTTYESKIQTEDAVNESIENQKGKIFYKISFGQFGTEQEANAKVEGLIRKLTSCNPNIGFSPVTDLLGATHYILSIQSEQTIRVYNSYFIIDNRGGKFLIDLQINGNETNNIATPIPPFTDYYKIDANPEQDEFSNALQKVFKEANSSFATFKGKELPTGEYDLPKNVATFRIPGYSNCYLETSLSDQVSYQFNMVFNELEDTSRKNTRML